MVLVLGSLTFLASEQATAATYVRGPIVVDTVWNLAGSPYVIPDLDYVRIEGGVTLTIEPGVEVRFGRASEMLIAGQLVAVGTPEARIRFTSNASSPMPGDWEEIETLSGGRLTMRWVNLTYAVQPLYLRTSNNTVEDCEISRSYRVLINGDDNLIARCHIHDNLEAPAWTTIGLHAGFAGRSKGNAILDNTFEGNQADDIRIYGSDSNFILNNTFLNGRFTPVWVDEAENNTVSGNTIMGYASSIGVYLSGAVNATVRGNRIDGTLWGIFFDGLRGARRNIVEENRIVKGERGLYLVGSGVRDNVIRNNTIADQGIGIQVDRDAWWYGQDWGPPSGNAIYHNRIVNNAVQAIDNATPDGNAWDAGCPLGGNYWSDYVGGDAVDCATGLPGTDGLGDSPYVIDADSRDDYPLLAPPDRVPPEMFNATLSGETALATNLSALGPLPFRAIADDARTGGSRIAVGNYTFGPGNWPGTSMGAWDGTFDEANETLTATIDPPRKAGAYAYCAYATDAAGNGNETGVCGTLTVVDDVPPRLRDVTLDGQPSRSVVRGTPVLLEAVVDDAATGGTVIGGANVTSPRAAWSNATALVPRDALDAEVEAFARTVDTSALPVGTYDLCVYGWDSIPNGNTTGACAVLTLTLATRPDLAPATPQPGAGVRTGLSLPTTFSLRVRNLGDATSGDSTLAFYNESDPAVPFATFAVPPLGPSQDAGPFAASWISPAAPGTYRVVADVDYGDRIVESNESNNRFTWTIEVLAGPVTRLVVGAPNHTSDATYVTSATPLTFSVLDQSGAGIRNTTYRIDEGPWRNYTATGPFTLPGEGEHVVEWYSEDHAGNVEPAASGRIRVDDTPPATTLAVGDPKHVSADTYVTSATPLTLAAADGGILPVGVGRVEYRIDVGAWIPYTGPFTLSGEDPAAVAYRSVDLLGNRETASNVTIVVDDSPPTVAVTVGTPSYASTDTWVTSRTPLQVTAADSGPDAVGLDRTEYQIDGGGWTPYASPFTLTGDAPHLVEARAWDRLGNGGSAARYVIVDDIAPDVSLVIGDPSFQGAETFVTSATPISVDALDPGSNPVGLASVEYRIDGGAWVPYSTSFTLPGPDGLRRVQYASRDQLGNRNEAAANLVVDDTPPETEIAPRVGPHTPDTVFALTPTDAGSGVARTEYRVDDGLWRPYAGGFSLAPGDHTIGYRSVDRLNNTEAERTLSVTVEGAPPPAAETNWKPLVAATFAILLAIAGVQSSSRRPWNGGTGRKAVLWAFAATSLPFVLAETATGFASWATGILSIPPLLGSGTAVDLGILIAGLGAAGIWSRGRGSGVKAAS